MTNEYDKPEHALIDRIPYLSDEEHAQLTDLIVRHMAAPNDDGILIEFLEFWGEFDPKIQTQLTDIRFKKGMVDLFNLHFQCILNALEQLLNGDIKQVTSIADTCTKLGVIGQQFKKAVDNHDWGGMIAAKDACARLVDDLLAEPG